MSTPILPPYVPPFSPVPQVTPFTYRDGLSYLQRMERLVKYLNRVVIPFVNTHYSELAEAFTEEVNTMIEAFNASVAEVNDAIVAAEASATAAAASAQAAEDAVSEISDLQDAAITAIWNDTDSDFRTALDAAYGLSEEINDVIDIVMTGRLSEATLDARFLTKVDQTEFDSFETSVAGQFDSVSDSFTDVNTDLAGKAPMSVKTVQDTGRLSEDVLDARFNAANQSSLPVKLGGYYGVGPFTYLQNASKDPTQDTRVVTLGSSTANGAHTTQPEMAVFERLARRNGCLAGMTALSSVVSAVSPAGVKWWNGAAGNQTSLNYYPSGRQTCVGYVDPHYVIHMIGSNDYFYGTSLADYKNAVDVACDHIESVNPDVWNILIHQQGRDDVTTPVASWDDYGEALAEVAALNPGNRIFIDLSEYFDQLGVRTNNQSGIQMPDAIHMDDIGHRFLANILSAKFGIPSEYDFNPAGEVIECIFPASATYTTNGQVFATTSIRKTNYPRTAKLIGQVYLTPSVAGNMLGVTMWNVTDGVAVTGSVDRQATGLTTAHTKGIANRYYLKPNKEYEIRFSVLIPSSGNINVSGSAGYTRCDLEVTPI